MWCTSYHTLVTISSGHQSFTEAASRFTVAWVSSRERPQSITRARWHKTHWVTQPAKHTLVLNLLIMTYVCSRRGRRSDRNEPVCSVRSVLLQRWLYSDTDRRWVRLERPSNRRRCLRLKNQQGHSHRLETQRDKGLCWWNSEEEFQKVVL